MISIIISTYRPELLQQVEASIQATIGVPYELIPISNKGQMGICAAYNIGATKAQYELLCFLHEDVEMTTQNWGKLITDAYANDPELVLCGVAGSKYKSTFATGWTTGIEQFDMMHVVNRSPDGNRTTVSINPTKEQISGAVVLDGVCLFMPRKEWQTTKFDEQLTGFHFYDLDIALRVSAQRKKVAVIFFIDIVHFSEGKFNDSWVEAALSYHELPGKVELIKSLPDYTQHKKHDKATRLYWLGRLATEEINSTNRFRLFVGNYKLYKELSVNLFRQGKHQLKLKLLRMMGR